MTRTVWTDWNTVAAGAALHSDSSVAWKGHAAPSCSLPAEAPTVSPRRKLGSHLIKQVIWGVLYKSKVRTLK